MEKSSQQQCSDSLPPVNSAAAIDHFKDALASGKHWFIALLESIGIWNEETEEYQGQEYRYLIDGEAFDWLLLASRLCDSVDGQIPEKEKYALLFQGKAPIELSRDEFKSLIGQKKYHQYLNFFYGVMVEEALVQTVREEVRKERFANGLRYQLAEENEIFRRIYGENEDILWKLFRRERQYHGLSSNLTEMKEFTYWCFKYRIKTCEKARVASDTRKALQWLKNNGFRYRN
jgi:hypothetical protein